MPLPKNLDILPHFDISRELHLQGRYRIDKVNTQNISFTIKEDSFFRVYLYFVTVDIDLYLYQNGEIMDFSVTIYQEEIISRNLRPGSYILQLRPIRGMIIDVTDTCSSGLIEIAISPVAITLERYNNYDLPELQLLPLLDFAPLSIGKPLILDTDDSKIYNIRANRSSGSYVNTNIKNYDFTLSPKPGTTPLFEFQATLGYDFLTGGSVRLVLTVIGTEPNCFFYNFTNCLIGQNLVSNRHTLQTTLGPGNYSLWIVDVSYRRFDEVSPCTPISFEISISQNSHKENFISCHAESIPTNLGDIGYLDDTGYLHFRELVFIDLSNGIHVTEFTLRTRSLFRVFIEAHRVDIDLELKNSSGVVARTVLLANTDESIMLVLEPDVLYTLNYIYYNGLYVTFCETFLLEIAIEPATTSYQLDYCYNHTTVLPNLNLSPITSALVLPRTRYYYFFEGGHSGSIFSISVSTITARNLVVKIGSTFLSGLSLTLSQNRNVTTNTETDYNSLKLSSIITPGLEYKLELKSGSTQTQQDDLVGFPPCVYFDLEISAIDASLIITNTCDATMLPKDLSGPQYLGTSNRVHVQREFLVPRTVGGFETEDTMSFQVRKRSIFRAYTELPESVSIGFILKADGVSLPHVISEEGMEKVTAILLPEKQYVLTVAFSADFELLPPCYLWNFEFEIAPVEEGVINPPCASDMLPPYTFTVPLPLQFDISNTYAFTQTDVPFVHKIDFTITEFAYFRGLLFYDFVWSEMSLRILDNGTILTMGKNRFNKNEIEGFELVPGQYTLEIFEPEGMEVGELRRCTEFRLNIGIASIYELSSSIGSSPSFTGCGNLYFPKTFNSVPFLSNISGNIMHFSQDILMDLQNRFHYTKFNLEVESYFRILIPPHAVNIDVIVDSLNDEEDVIERVARSTGLAEEFIYVRLQPGLYRILFQFSSFIDKYGSYYWPSADTCATFRIEIAIYPVQYIADHLTLSDPCDITNLPEALEYSQPVSIPVIRSTSQPDIKFNFTINRPTLISTDVSYIFVSGGLYMTLTGTNIISPFLSAASNRTWVAYTMKDFQYFDHVIYPGDYAITISDMANYTDVHCTKFNFNYFLDVGNVPPNYCDDADTFPTDLYSEKGGSRPYGGPQNTDGSIRLSGTHFLLPPLHSHTNIFFKIVNTSWARLWISSKSSSDIDFYIWNNASKTSLIVTSFDIGAVESQLILLQPSSDYYLLDITVFSRTDNDCEYVSLELAIEPNITTYELMRCIDPLPNPILPPSFYRIDPYSLDIFSDFAFTKEYIDAHSMIFRTYRTVTYDMTLHVVDGNYTIVVLIGFEFLISDFTCSLYQQNSLLAQSVSEAPIFDNSFIDFQSHIIYTLSPGNYTLRIQEKIYNIHQIHDGECENFFFMLWTQRRDSTAPPHVTIVMPPSGSELDASQSLSIEISFSESVGPSVPTEYIDLLNWNKNHSAVYLQSQILSTGTIFPSGGVYPSNMHFSLDKAMLTVIFTNLQFDRKYTLILNAQEYTNVGGTPFERYTELHEYVTLSCLCNGHGICYPFNSHTRECLCDVGYAGPECKSCDEGYHRAGTSCILNTFCTPTICNGHGTCDDSLGYPICECNVGYDSNTTAYCIRCHPGYTGYPNCESIIDDRLTRCTAPLLPNDLNTIAYLGSEGSVHIQDNYFLDVEHYSHSLFFNISVDSYFRVYIEPHVIDIDMMLFLLPDGLLEHAVYITNSFKLYKEETIFQFLQPGDYYLDFYFYPTSSVSTCPTANIELAIEPVTSVLEEEGQYLPDCAVHGTPQIDVQTIPLSGYTYSPTQVFSYNVSDVYNGEVWSTTFTILETPNQIAKLETEIRYRFLSSDLAMKIVRVDVNDTEPLAVGQNRINIHYLHHYLYEGTYKFIIYLPEPPVGTCFTFEMYFSVVYISEEQDVFNCNYPQLPASLDDPSFRGPRVHVYDQFLVEESRNTIKFNVDSLSTIRIAATSDTHFVIYLENESGSKLATSNNHGQLLYRTLNEQENYQIKFVYTLVDGIEDGNFCPTIEVEIAILNNTRLNNYYQNIICPQGGISVLPSISNQLTLPYYFDPLPVNLTGYMEHVYYSYGPQGDNDEVTNYQFHVPNDAFIEVGIGSHFLSGNLELSILLPNGDIINSRSGQEDYNYIRQVISPGDYNLKIRHYIPTSDIFSCVPFSFHMSVVTLESYEADDCSHLTPIPRTLDSLRYLNSDGHLSLQSSNWAVPPFPLYYTIHDMYFTIKTDSLFRIYVAEEVIDVDIYLYMTNNTDNEIIQGQNYLDEESFVITLSPAQYLVRFYFFNWNFEEPHCPVFNMEIEISPVIDLPVISKLCPTGVTEIWPNLPTSITGKSFPYIYNVPTTTFYYQQVDHNDPRHVLKSYTLSIDSNYDIHVEIGYNFLIGDLLLQFGNTIETVTGDNYNKRNIINIKNLAAGTYTLSIYEVTSNDPTAIGCNFFTFKLYIDSPSNVDTKVFNPYIPLPSTLQGIPYLRYTDKVHFQGEYLILDNNPSVTTVSMSFTLKKDSIVRATVGQASPFYLSFQSEGILNQFPSIVAVLPVGDHALNFNLRDQYSDKNILSDLEFAIFPADKLTSKIATLSCNAPKWTPPSIVVRPTDGYYHYREKHALLIEDQIKSRDNLYTIPFSITQESILSIQLEYDFILSDLILIVRSKNNQTYTPTRYGVNHYNLDDINTHLIPGNYEIIIRQTLPWSDTVHRLTCSEFDIRIIISNMTIPSDRVDCTSYSILPWDLNSDTGGSVPFGGPIRFNFLHLWYDRFLLNPVTNRLSTDFTLQVPSVITIFTSEYFWSQLYFTISKKLSTSDQEIVAPVVYDDQYFQKVGLYRLNGGDYVLNLDYFLNSFSTCSSFSLGISIQSVDAVAEYLENICSSQSVGHKKLPKTLPSTSLSISSFFTEEDIQENSNIDGYFSYNMTFIIQDAMYLDVSLSYDSLTSFFKLTLLQNFEYDTYSPITTGIWNTMHGEPNLRLTQRINYQIREGSYLLNIEQPPLSKPDQQRIACYPFDFNFQIFSLTSGPLILYIEPASGTEFDPSRDLFVEVRFSEPVYNVNSHPVTRFENTVEIANALYLYNENDHTEIKPSEIRVPEDNPIPDDFTRWTLIYSHSTFKYGNTYSLKLRDYSLYNKEYIPFKMPNSHSYTMTEFDMQCRGHGTYNSQTQVCDCDPSTFRTGDQCDKCIEGYQFDTHRIKCIPKETCEPNPCGCLPGTGSIGLCKPIGKCTENPQNPLNRITCTCTDSRYTGPRCDLCSEGYVDYPYCAALCNPPCVHGICSNLTGTCTCAGNFVGHTCSDCSPGFSGGNCDVPSKMTGIIVGALLAVAITVVLIGVLVWRCTSRSNTSDYSDPTMEMELESGKKITRMEDDDNDNGGVELEGSDSDEENLLK